ncbi:MAG: hypothetical protein RQ875_12970 [Vicingaceae bacterium]|nr:hypothetical protein [Vicingaceae bacterium]
MEEFNINEGNNFVKKIQCLETVNEISIIDTKADGNDFVVNEQSIFLDTNQQDKPNYYNYKRRARELNISADCLLECLKSFYKIGVNEFNRDDNYYRFPVVVGFTTNKGYIYSNELNLMLGDTLSATSVRNKKYHFKIVLTKQIDKAWFEYYQIGEI